MLEQRKQRLAYIDWMRGLACVLMFQTHCYDSWLGGDARNGAFIKWSQLGGTLPAPLFLFLAGISFAFVTDKLRQRGVSANEIARTTIRRGAEIFGLGLLFRVQEFLLGWPGAPWTDLLRVDVLNIIGFSMVLMGIVCRAAAVDAQTSPPMTGARSKTARVRTIFAAVLAASTIALLAPPLWTTWRPRWLPWFLESYINGVHTLDKPQPWLFPIFPWSAFAFAGLVVGLLLLSDWARRYEVRALALAGIGGVALYKLGLFLDARPRQLYADYDFWHTSPNFVLCRVGILLVILFGSYAWCRWGAGQWGFSPMIQLGTTSLLVYWVHIEFVYGGMSILPKRSVGVATASWGLLAITVAMLLLSIARTRLKGKNLLALIPWRRMPRESGN